MELIMHRMTWWGLIVLAIGSYTSITFSSLSHILLFVPGLYFCIKAIQTKNLNLSHSSRALIGLFIAIFCSILANLDILESPLKNLFKGKYFVIGVLSIFAFRESFKKYIDEKKIKFLIKLFLFSSALATISGLIGLYTGFTPLKFKAACHPTRACGLFGMYMTYGYAMGFLATILTSVLIYREKFKRWIAPEWLFTCWGIAMAGLILSYARGAWVGFVVSLPFIFLRESKKKFILTILCGLLISGSALLFNNKVRETFFSKSRTQSTQTRYSFYLAAFHAFKERPFFGHGHRNFEPNMKKIKKEYGLPFPELGGHGHNNFLEQLASTGALGLVFLVLFHFFWIKESFFDTSLLGLLTFPLLIHFLVSGQVQYTFGDGENLFFLMGIFGLSHIKGLNKMLISS